VAVVGVEGEAKDAGHAVIGETWFAAHWLCARCVGL
jgi:hypothetical protein